MPHTESAKKRLRQNVKRRLRNRSVINDLRTEIRKLLKACKAGDAQAAQVELGLVYKKLDKCAARRYLHPNTAHRYKSRLAKRVSRLNQPPAKA